MNQLTLAGLFAATSLQAAQIEVANDLDAARIRETVEVKLTESGPVIVRNAAGTEVVSQMWGDDVVIFQADFAPKETKHFTITAGTPAKAEAQVFGRFVPERADDFAWESDRVAFRMYGPALQKNDGDKTGSGVDVWCKHVRTLIVNAMYKRKDYHHDDGTGVDAYQVGAKRGCGGSAIWADGKLWPSRCFTTWKVLANGPIRVAFELTYAPWDANGRQVSEVKRVSIDAGSNLNRFESRYETGNQPVTAAAGLQMHSPASTVAHGDHWASVWEKGGGDAGFIPMGLVWPASGGGQFKQADGHALTVVDLKANEPFVYYAGAGWSKGPDFPDAATWNAYVKAFAARVNSPLRVTVKGAPIAGSSLALPQPPRDWRKTALHAAKPDGEIVRLDMDGDGRADMLERWWNDKRVRWLDEAGTLRADDTRGDQVNGLLQIDMDGDGFYDGDSDINIKWCDADGDGIPDVQAFVTHPSAPGKPHRGVGAHWMLFINHDKRGVLGWMDWQKFSFDCWGHTDKCNWLPNYHGNCDFLKIHRAPQSLADPRLNWENPFSFYDFDGDGLSEMAMRWCDPYKTDGDKTKLTGQYNEAFVTYDLANDSSRGNETCYDMTLRGAGGPGLAYADMVHPLPHFKGNPKFDPCFQWNNWRRISEVKYIPQSKQYETFFAVPWERMYFVFDEDHDDNRWERVELYYPTAGISTNSGKADIYSTERWSRRKPGAAASAKAPGLGGHPQADSIGDRGEFDMDNSGNGQLYIGAFDRKLHLYGAEWGAWTVDAEARYHGGAAAPTTRPSADKVEEVVKYTDTDNNGFFDTIEYDYKGDGVVDFKVCLLDYKTPDTPHPDVVALCDAKREGWKGLHEIFNATAQRSWIEAQQVYRAAWRRGLTTPELDMLMQSSSLSQRYQQAYWIKEKVFRLLRARLAEEKSVTRDTLEKDLTHAYYTGHCDDYIQLIGRVPSK